MKHLSILRRATALVAVAVTLSIAWAAVPAHADPDCPWRVVPAGGSLWAPAPWWPYLFGGLLIVAGVVLGILFWRRRKKEDDEQPVAEKTEAPEK